jgi:hypothetical protein
MFFGVCPSDKWGVLEFVPGRGCCIPASKHVKGKLSCCRKDNVKGTFKRGNKFSIACGGKSTPDTDSDPRTDGNGGSGGGGGPASPLEEISEMGGIPTWAIIGAVAIVGISFLTKKKKEPAK